MGCNIPIFKDGSGGNYFNEDAATKQTDWLGWEALINRKSETIRFQWVQGFARGKNKGMLGDVRECKLEQVCYNRICNVWEDWRPEFSMTLVSQQVNRTQMNAVLRSALIFLTHFSEGNVTSWNSYWTVVLETNFGQKYLKPRCHDLSTLGRPVSKKAMSFTLLAW